MRTTFSVFIYQTFHPENICHVGSPKSSWTSDFCQMKVFHKARLIVQTDIAIMSIRKHTGLCHRCPVVDFHECTQVANTSRYSQLIAFWKHTINFPRFLVTQDHLPDFPQGDCIPESGLNHCLQLCLAESVQMKWGVYICLHSKPQLSLEYVLTKPS